MSDISPTPLTVAPILNNLSPHCSDDLDPVDTFKHLFMTEETKWISTTPLNPTNPQIHLGEYRQLTIQECETPEAFMSLIQIEFVGNPTEHTIQAREEFLKMKCCSFQKTDLETHYNRMSQRFYCLQGIDDVNLKGVFLNSFPKSLANEVKTFLDDRNVMIAKQHWQRNPRDKKKWKFVRKKQTRGRTSDCCFNCQKKGHFARDCPDKKKSESLIQALNQIEPVEISDIESLYSLDDEPTDDAILSLPYLDYSSDEDSDPYQPRSGVFMINHVPPNVEQPPIFENPHSLGIQPYPRHTTNPRPIPHLLSIQRTQPMPLAKVHLLTDVYAKPIPVIAFFDTGYSVSIINPNILPARFWKPHYQTFYAANGQTFVVNKVNIPINIRLFPRCVIRHRFLGCNSVAKDVLIGFDLILKLLDMRFLLTGLRYKSFFNPYSPVQRVCMTTPVSIDTIRQSIIQTSCANSHTEFLKKNPSPLWLNPDFFVELSFKQNEDVNPTKASHPDMNPDHYQLAVQECDDLVEQGVIESTTSPWACKAFYVNKRNEHTRGKLRLVINYQPLNQFLADDKFPLPQKKSLFQSLVNAKVMSKFDLKSGFWQLGIQPRDRPKTAFSVLNHHFQWKVMSFGLKNAPSAFQKAMIRIFEPILENTLIYIDDILLFSPDESSHMVLLSKFHDLVRKYGIMLSESKMEVGVSSIEFLGMKISDGKYQPQSHIAKELVHFPDELRSQKEIQQFLGVVNYMSDFLPKLSTHTVWLFPMLKKNPPTWTKRQTEAVREIKKLADVMPPLKIPSTTDKKILQTDASDDYWGEVLLIEDSSSVISICGYKSGTFKVSEHHYHSTFKEILAWKFIVKHIKGTDNVLADFLSRPMDYKSKVTPSTSSKPIKMVHLIELGSSSSSTETPLSQCAFPTIEEQMANLPNNIQEAIADITLPKRATLSYKLFLTILLQRHGEFMKGLRFHPNYPFLNVFHIHDLFRLPKEALVFFWYLLEAHTIAISFNGSKLVEYVFHFEFNKPTAESKPSGPSRNLFTLLEWFLLGHTWAHQLAMVQKKYVVIMFHRPVTYHAPETLCQNQPQLYHALLSFIHEWLRHCLAHANRVDPATIPKEIMHELTSWSDNDPVSSHWIQALEEWRRTHLQGRIDTSDEDIDFDSDADSGYFPDMDETHFDPYEDDPSHEDSRWK
ncbi:hypothetical protein LXL04_027699 [Taraxacum kok-saghyz]